MNDITPPTPQYIELENKIKAITDENIATHFGTIGMHRDLPEGTWYKIHFKYKDEETATKHAAAVKRLQDSFGLVIDRSGPDKLNFIATSNALRSGNELTYWFDYYISTEGRELIATKSKSPDR